MESKHVKTRKHLFLPGLLERTRHTFEKIKDSPGRKGGVSLPDCLMSGVAMFGLKYPSLLQFDSHGRDKDSPLAHNLHALYGIGQIPSDTCMRERLDAVDPLCLQKPINRIIAQLQRGKVLEMFRYHDDYCLVALDGTGCFSSHEIHCDNCCVKNHRDGSVTYYHQMLAAVMVNPAYKTVLPLMIEPVQKSDGMTKNDCEHSAAKRLLRNLREAHPHLKMIVVMDGLYADGEIINLLKELKFHFIITSIEKDMKYLHEFYRSVPQRSVTEQSEGMERVLKYAENLPLNASRSDIEVNMLECEETTTGKKKKKTKKVRFCWITDLSLNDGNISRIAKGGRARWKVENETFNTLKNQGYQFDHNFGHGYKNLSVVFAYLMFTAFLIDQIQEFSCKYFKAALAAMWGTRKYLWERMRSMFFEYFIDTWEDLYSGIIQGIRRIPLSEVINTS